ncbi:MAG: hypothetical protein QOD73_2718, partial [Solirubrobacteraceae bacterium]|nr:hypothetical protein [Solirubrobacteraceae bacterium]
AELPLGPGSRTAEDILAETERRHRVGSDGTLSLDLDGHSGTWLRLA